MNPAMLNLFTISQLIAGMMIPFSWTGDYREALREARREKIPLVVTLEDMTSQSGREEALSDPATVAMVACCQICRVDVRTLEGRRIAAAFGARTFPYTVVCDRDGETIRCRLSGSHSVAAWRDTICGALELSPPWLTAAVPTPGEVSPEAESASGEPTTVPDSAAVGGDAKPEGPRFTLVVATMPNCLFCERLRTETLESPDVKTILGNFEVKSVNKEEDPETLAGYGISIYPSLVVISPEGAPLGKISGFVPPDALATQLRDVLGGQAE